MVLMEMVLGIRITTRLMNDDERHDEYETPNSESFIRDKQDETTINNGDKHQVSNNAENEVKDQDAQDHENKDKSNCSAILHTN